jgi:hypothetical protein
MGVVESVWRAIVDLGGCAVNLESRESLRPRKATGVEHRSVGSKNFRKMRDGPDKIRNIHLVVRRSGGWPITVRPRRERLGSIFFWSDGGDDFILPARHRPPPIRHRILDSLDHDLSQNGLCCSYGRRCGRRRLPCTRSAAPSHPDHLLTSTRVVPVSSRGVAPAVVSVPWARPSTRAASSCPSSEFSSPRPPQHGS